MAFFEKRSVIGVPASRVFAWHQRPEALESLIPPWESVTIEQRPSSLGDGARAVLLMKMGPFKLRWVAEHTGFVDRGEEGGEFTDFQVSGPFASWRHQHIVRARGPNSCILEDKVIYELPLGLVGRAFGSAITIRKLQRMFDFRHAQTARLCQST